MQTIIAQKAAALESTKRAKEKRAAKSTKAHSKRWLKQEYGAELAGAIESEIDALQQDTRIVGGVCKYGPDAVENSALRGHRLDKRCESRVKSRVNQLLEELQDDLVSAVISGKGAGIACAALLPRCEAHRARLLLGPKYRDDLGWHELEFLQVGYGDEWTVHKDVDGSVYWYNRGQMVSQREPPEGWAKDVASGEWRKQGAASPQEPLPSPAAQNEGLKDET